MSHYEKKLSFALKFSFELIFFGSFFRLQATPQEKKINVFVITDDDGLIGEHSEFYFTEALSFSSFKDLCSNLSLDPDKVESIRSDQTLMEGFMTYFF